VALLVSDEGAEMLAREAAARNFVAAEFAPAKLIAFAPGARPLLERAGVVPDDGCMMLEGEGDAEAFVTLCRKLRHWERDPKVHAI
jgi:catalase